MGTRPSALARWQTDWVIARLRAAWPNLTYRIQTFSTRGDDHPDQPLPELGGKGAFTGELEEALRRGEIDVAVHSLKDLEIEDAPGLTLGAICARADPRDALVTRDGRKLSDLPAGASTGTCSLRRTAQLLAVRPDLAIRPLRGNVDTRVRKALAGEYDAIVLAAAGLIRLGLEAHIAEYLPLAVMLPAPGQAALAVQCRADDSWTLATLAPLDDSPTRAAVTAERAFLAALGGGCAAPVAALGQVTGEGAERLIYLSGLVAAPDGSSLVRVQAVGPDPAALGSLLAEQALAQGAGELLA